MTKENTSDSSADVNRSNSQQMIKYLYDHIVDYAIVNSVFNVHREVSIGLSIGLYEEHEKEKPKQTRACNGSQNCDIFGEELTSSKRQVECKCLICNRSIAASRFAPHLEKCIGINRRTTSKRKNEALDLPKVPSVSRLPTHLIYQNNLYGKQSLNNHDNNNKTL